MGWLSVANRGNKADWLENVRPEHVVDLIDKYCRGDATVEQAGLTILGQESPLFVTASGSVHIPGLSAKWFDGDIVRIDVTPSNIAQILALTGGES